MAELRELVLDRVAIEELIGQYVSLKPAGREFKARCPFHEEKTPSFTVSPDKGFFYCFGCKASGNAIDFVMQMENLEFRDALEWLANRYSIEIPQYSGGGGQQRGEKQRLYEVNEAALAFFRKSLELEQAAAARAYLERRGVSESLVREFDLGYAPGGWQALADALLSRGAKAAELLKLGLVREKRDAAPGAGSQESRHYDSFRNRLMFPIRQVTGRVIGFAGRALSDEDNPKYLNVTNTPLYDKSSVLYNLDRAKGFAREDGVVVVEGYMDVIGLAAYGVHNTVATCGTALTPEHIKLLSRYGERFYLAFDGDRAGREAAWSAGKLFLAQGIDARVVNLPGGKDPDEFIREEGLDAWNGLLGAAVSVVRFWLDYQLETHPQADVAFKRQLATQLSGMYKVVPDWILQRKFHEDVSFTLMLHESEVKALLGGVQTVPKASASAKIQLRDEARRSSLMQGDEPVEREVLRRLASDPEFLHTYQVLAEPDWFGIAEYREAYEMLLQAEDPLLAIRNKPLDKLMAAVFAGEQSLDSNELLLQRHRNLYLTRRVSMVQAQWERAVQSKDEQLELELRSEILELKSKIKQIRSVTI